MSVKNPTIKPENRFTNASIGKTDAQRRAVALSYGGGSMRVPGSQHDAKQQDPGGLPPSLAAARRSAESSLEAKLANDPEFRASYEDAETRSFLIDFFTQLRKRRGWSQTELAKRLKTTQSAVSDFEKRVAEPRLPTLQRWARVFGYRLEMQLWEGPLLAFNSWIHRSLPYESVVRAVKVDNGIAQEWLAAAEACQAARHSGPLEPTGRAEQISFGFPVRIENPPIAAHYCGKDEFAGNYNRQLTKELERSA